MKVWDRREGRSKRPLLHYCGVICDWDARKAHARALAARGQRGDFTCPINAAGSDGRRNTLLKSTRRSLES
jgi:hypothetical protein